MRKIQFGSEDILKTEINELNLKAFYIGFDLGVCQVNQFSEIILDALVDFAFGYHTGILKQYDRRKLKEAARSLYSIRDFSIYKTEYIDKNKVLDEDDLIVNKEELDKKAIEKYEAVYNKRGEFGELILHVILRDYFGTAPLLSKIYFKDSDGITVHGFDSVHIGPDINDKAKYTLFLGESKLYYRAKGDAGKHGIKDLVQDIKNHLDVEFLKRECILISKKNDSYKALENYIDENTKVAYEEFLKIKDEFMENLQKVGEGKSKLQDIVSSITIPLICTYESELFSICIDDSAANFKDEYSDEVFQLKKLLDMELSKLPKGKGIIDKVGLNIILIMIPIPSKKELLTTLHTKLWNQQNA